MIKKFFAIFIVLIFSSIPVKANDYRCYEIYSIDEEKVVKVDQSNIKIQHIAERYLKNISGIYPKFDPIPNSGYGIKIPLNPPVKVKNTITDFIADFVIIMFPKDSSPFLIVFETENRLMCFTFNGDTESLLKLLNFKFDSKVQ